MKLLLDTHAFIWWDESSVRLPARVLRACQDPVNTLYLSLVSIWELQIKMQLGKLDLRLPLEQVIAEQTANGLVLHDIHVDDVLALADLPTIHRDPFDRLLVAQAQRGGFQLITNDAQVSRYGVPILW